MSDYLLGVNGRTEATGSTKPQNQEKSVDEENIFSSSENKQEMADNVSSFAKEAVKIGENAILEARKANQQKFSERVSELETEGLSAAEAWSTAKTEQYLEQGKSEQETANILELYDSGIKLETAEKVASLMEQGKQRDEAKFEVYKEQYLEKGLKENVAQNRANLDIRWERIEELKETQNLSHDEAWDVAKKEEFMRAGLSEDEAKEAVKKYKEEKEKKPVENTKIIDYPDPTPPGPEEPPSINELPQAPTIPDSDDYSQGD